MSDDQEPAESPRKSTRRWIDCSFEQQYLPDNRKESKLKRKIARATDRSKYKKTDQDKIFQDKEKKDLSLEGLIQGRVLAILPQEIIVDCDGKFYKCVLRGLFKKDKDRSKNLLTVGDIVWIEPQASSAGLEGSIMHIEERTSILSRSDHLLRRKEQLLAANIDQVLITASVLSPTLKPALIDRYIIAARNGNMEPIIVVNKIDLITQLTEAQLKFYKEFISTYVQLGFTVLEVSAEAKIGLSKLFEVMKNKASVFSGQSGAGKTSLINLAANVHLRVGEVAKTQKGAHTTTNAQLLPLPFGGWCVDTPGIRSFGVWDLKKDEVEGYFPEIFKVGRECRYSNCHHLSEPNCAVREAVEDGRISAMRFDSYQKLLLEVDSV